jgi:hypothetical protein
MRDGHGAHTQPKLEARNASAVKLAAEVVKQKEEGKLQVWAYVTTEMTTTDGKQEGQKQGQHQQHHQQAPAIAACAVRVAHDTNTTAALIRRLDQQKGIETAAALGLTDADAGDDEDSAWGQVEVNAVAAVVPAVAADVQQLDVQLAYLWRVHRVDYYGGTESSTAEEYEKASDVEVWGKCAGR